MRTFQVDTFIIGAPKAATTFLYANLRSHPDVDFGAVKEPRFFSSKYSKGFDFYHGLFDPDHMGRRIDASTAYSEAWQNHSSLAAARIYDYNPEAKIIYCVRHPVHRIVSEWRQVRWLLSNGHPWIARGTGIERCTTLEEDVKKFDGFADTSDYWERIKPYRNRFGDDRILVVFQEDVKAAATYEIHRILDFLGLSSADAFVSESPVHEGWEKGEARLSVKMLRRIPGYYSFAKHIPTAVKTLIVPLLKRNPDEGTEITPELLCHLESRLCSNTELFLEWAGKPADYYEFRQ